MTIIEVYEHLRRDLGAAAEYRNAMWARYFEAKARGLRLAGPSFSASLAEDKERWVRTGSADNQATAAINRALATLGRARTAGNTGAILTLVRKAADELQEGL